MPIQPIDYFLAAWFTLAALSTAYVGWDQYRNNPEPVVMKWGFILVTLYMGPFGLLLYVLADKEPSPGEHERFIQPSGSRVSVPRFIAWRATRQGSSSPRCSRRSSDCPCGSI